MSKQLEQRTYVATEVRAADDDLDFVLEGIAASYNVEANIGGSYAERIAPGAFTRSLKEKRDVHCFVNHDHNQVLGRTKNGTLQLKDTPKGLAFRCELDEDSPAHQSIYASVKRGDISECSFSFTVPDGGDVWDTAKDAQGRMYQRRTLTNVDLFDVSVVTFPAYKQGTDVAARAQELAEDAARRERARKLGEQIDADNRRRAAEQAAQIAKERM
jgi:uncharacterized protein